MNARPFKSERHAALSQVFPADLLSTGAMTGPHRKTRPYTLTWRIRIARWVRQFITRR